MTETFYDVLEVGRDATQEEVTDAYRRKVKEYHPDVSDAEDADEAFKRVVRAEEVLGDADERARYDRLGHESYLRRTGGVDADAGGADSTTSRRSNGGSTTAGGTDETDTNAGVGRAASRQSSAGWSDDTDASGRWSEDAHVGDDGATTYAVHDWDAEGAGPDTVTVRFTQQFAIYALALFALYPTIAYVALSPTYPLTVNLAGAACGVVLVGYSLTVPKLSLVTFGAWSVLAPLLALTVVGRSPWVELLAVLACWVPFGYAVVVAYFTRPT